MTIYDLFKVACIDVNVDLCKDIKTLKELETFANRDLKKKTKIYNNLLEFAQSL